MAELKSLIVNGITRLNNTGYAKNLYADKFITNGGTAQQYVKGDGTLGNISDFSGSGHNHDDIYLKLAGGTMTGASPINFTPNTVQMNFRPDHSSYNAKLEYMTAGNEALIFSTMAVQTSFMFINGLDLTNGSSYSSMGYGTSKLVALQIKNNRVSVGAPVRGDSDTNAAKFYVYQASTNGSPYGTYIYDTGNSWAMRTLTILCPNLSSGSSPFIMIGKADSSKNNGWMGYVHNSDGSDNNRLSFGLHSVDNVLNILGSGNVGIGTTSPQSKLHIKGDLLIDNDFSENDHGIFFRSGFVSSNKYNVSILAYDHNSSGDSPDGISINGYDGISFCTGSNTRNEVVRITGGGSPGNVGIGTTSPSYKLHTVGKIAATSSNNTAQLIPDADCGLYLTTSGQWIHIAGSGSTMYIYNGAWDSAGTANYSKGIQINTSNNIGIGGSPSSKLHVSGGILKITNNSNTVSIGSQNSSWCHVESGITFYFSPSMAVNGNVYPYTNNTRTCGTTSNYWSAVYSYGFYKNGSSDSYILLGGGGHQAVSDFVPKRHDAYFYPYITKCNGRPWYKVTLAHNGHYRDATSWYMITMQINLGGSYSNGSNGRIFLSYYFTKASGQSGAYQVGDVRGIGIGCKLTDNGVTIKYDIANPTIFYIKANNNRYNSISIDTLTANDTSPSFDYRTTTIEAVTECPSNADKIVPLSFIETSDGNDLKYNNNTIITNKNYNTTSVANLDGTYYLINCTVSSSGTISFASNKYPAAGCECHLIIYNSGSSAITITMPSSINSVTCRRTAASLVIAAGSFGDVSILLSNGVYYIRCI